jgi:hypothetical protein
MNPEASVIQEKINEELVKIKGLLEKIDPRALTPIQLPRTLDELVKIRDLLKKIAKKTKRRGKRKPK